MSLNGKLEWRMLAIDLSDFQQFKKFGRWAIVVDRYYAGGVLLF